MQVNTFNKKIKKYNGFPTLIVICFKFELVLISSLCSSVSNVSHYEKCNKRMFIQIHSADELDWRLIGEPFVKL